MKPACSPSAVSGAHCRDGACRPAVLALLISVVAGALSMAHAQTAPPEPVQAVLKLHELGFFYRSSRMNLPCNYVQARVAYILVALGARRDIEVGVHGCDLVVMPSEDPEDPWQMPGERGPFSDRWDRSSDRFRAPNAARRERSMHVRVRAMMPIEVTPEVLEEIKRDKSRRELISRVTGDPSASLDDPVIFPAQRQVVTLSRHTIDLQPEDCELLEEMSRSVLRELGMRIVRRGFSCSGDRRSRIAPELTVEALLPIMPETPQINPAEPTPAAPEDASEQGAGSPR